MSKLSNRHKMLKGQVIPLVVFMMFVIIAIVALILDGGAIMSNRRTAQAAADAGALAGAQRLCYGKSDAQAVAQAYAINNGAVADPPPSVTISGLEITVATTTEHPSFFAKILGEDWDTATAQAKAGCYYPSVAKRLLPISFYYESPPVNAKEAVCKENGTCGIFYWPIYDLLDTLYQYRDANVVTGQVINLPLDDIYIIANKTKVCEKNITGDVVCYEMAENTGGGNRSFLNFGEELKKIIQNGLEIAVHLPAWVNGKPGAESDVFLEKNFTDFPPITGYEDLDARLYFVPVFKEFCPSDPQNNCEVDPDDHYEYLENPLQPSYRLIGFAPFVVTCVTQSDKCTFGECVPTGTYEVNDEPVTLDKTICPGYLRLKLQLEAAAETGDPEAVTALDEFNKSSNALEGYFVDEVPADEWIWGTEGVDVGIYLISLSE